MDTNTKRVANWMQDQLRTEGYSVIVTNTRGEWVALASVEMGGIMRLHYPDDAVTPAEVVSAVADLLNKINGK